MPEGSISRRVAHASVKCERGCFNRSDEPYLCRKCAEKLARDVKKANAVCAEKITEAVRAQYVERLERYAAFVAAHDAWHAGEYAVGPLYDAMIEAREKLP